MKNQIFKIQILFVLFIFFCSCQKSQTIIPAISSSSPSINIDHPETRSSYISIPAPSGPSTNTPTNTFTTYSQPGTNLNGATGLHKGGTIRAKVVSQSNNVFVIQISKQDGTNFPSNTVGRLRMGSVSYTTLASATLNSPSPTISITVYVSIGTGYGVLDIFPTATFGGYNYYAEPIVIYTSPTHNAGNFSTNGGLLGTVSAVNLYSSGPGVNPITNMPSTNCNLSSQWQCTDFCKRYYSQVYGLTIPLISAGTYHNLSVNQLASYGLIKYSPGAIAPRVGDILEFSGHVMIIVGVADNKIKVAHQNSGTALSPTYTELTRTGNNISTAGFNGQTFLGVLRKL